ncbi:hypothetical protein [Prevotella sp. 10(H)]|uniref:hypothetical protein n=1 Tax=Prevotella sp. 10(H) TaxID=1158294 RepID=UPI0004A6E85B|nr:hypothetical protein [Prevotella sp. 10(H)]
MKINPKVKNTIFQISALLILLAAVIYSLDVTIAKYVMATGVLGFTVTTITTPYPGKSIRGKRLFNIQVFALILMIVSTVLLFKDISGWVVTLLIAAVLTLYSNIAMSKVYKKEQEE